MQSHFDRLRQKYDQSLTLKLHTPSQYTLSQLSYDTHVVYVIFCFEEDTRLQKVP